MNKYLENFHLLGSAAAFIFKLLSAFFLAYIFPIKHLLTGLAILTLVDVVVGIIVSRKNGEKYDPDRMAKTVTKLWAYPLAIVICNYTQIIFLADINLAQWAAGFLAMKELSSILIHIGKLTGVDIWTFIESKFEDWKPKKPKE